MVPLLSDKIRTMQTIEKVEAIKNEKLDIEVWDVRGIIDWVANENIFYITCTPI